MRDTAELGEADLDKQTIQGSIVATASYRILQLPKISIEEFAKEKLFWMDMSLRGRFAYSDTEDIFATTKAS